MNLEKKYQGKPKGGAGLGQGKKKTKIFSKKTFALDIKVVDILAEYSQGNGFQKGMTIEFVELAILELHKQLQNINSPGIDQETYVDFQNRKDKLFIKVAERYQENSEQFL